MRSLLLSLSLLAACGPDTTIAKQKIDDDGDGFSAEVDCDDAHATVNPDATEVCDGVDNDCDTVVDNDDATDAPTWYADADGDEYGDPDAPTLACEAPADTVADATDCDDAEAAAFPGNPDVCDSVDNDCNGAVDDDPVDLSTFHQDADGDGYGDPATATLACEPATGEVADGTDCDDADAAIHPDAVEDDCADATDYNCDGSVGYVDADGDGTPACEDCDDGDAARSPTASEICDALDVDEDCDGASDDDDASVTDAPTWGRDLDADGYSGGTGTTLVQCEQPTGYASSAGDCDDLDSAANPGEAEICDALDTDEDCDGLVDDADPSTDAASWNRWYADRDGDAYGDSTRVVSQCESPASYVANDDDCDDTTAARNPGALEVCDAADLDEDCDGSADDADTSVTGGTTYHTDADGDGYGGTTSRNACSSPVGYVTNDDDCNDASTAISPAAAEVCDSANVDEDCDGLADDSDTSASGKSTWFRDADSDGYAGTTSTAACDTPTGYLATSTDCNDASAAISPAATEVCDAANVDEDCDGLADDGDTSATGKGTWYRDADSDGYAGTTSTAACEQPSGYLATSTDCNDASAAISPGDPEICDAANVDEDCDGSADDSDSSATGETTWYRDADVDTFGNAAISTSTCDLPSGYVANDDDCDDTTATIGSNRTWYRDADSDGYGLTTTTSSSCTQPSGYVATSGDCNDASGTVSPAASEACDAANVDEDCDGLADDLDSGATGRSTWYRDADSDTYGSATTTASACDLPSGYVSNATDCDDTEATAHPGGTEVCDDDIDQDCVGGDEVCETGGFDGDYAVNTGYDTKIYGVLTGDRFGYAMVAGDFNGDGLGDLVVGAPYNTYSSYQGTAYGYYGPFSAGVETATDNDDFLVYDASSTYSGSFANRLYNVGDLNADGKDELLIGANSVTTFLYLGGVSAGADAHTVDDVASFSCTSAAPAGDFNATTGTDEWICGYTNYVSYTGIAYVYSGTSTTAIATFPGETGSYAGQEVAGGGDVDGDGYDDIWVGAYAASSNAGAVYLVYAPVSGTFNLVGADAKITGGTSSDYLGYKMTSPGDVDGDGHDDLLAAAYGQDGGGTSAGAVYVFADPVSGTAASQATATIRGEDALDQIGGNGISTGDFDGDGEIDLLIGTPDNDDTPTNGGAAWLVYGPLSGTISLGSADAEWLGSSSGDYLGATTAGLPDTDSDGKDELVMGAVYGDERGYVNHGAVWIWNGQ